MAETKRVERPLSPFMIGQYYRPQMTSISSILTRITGNALIITTILAVWWLMAATGAPSTFETVNWLMTSFIGDLVFTVSVLGLWYHYLAGLRHFYFDSGRGLDIETAEKLGMACMIGSVVLTLLTIIIV
ncbi:succinate dehydrogenase, cytochrome b556 subunit [Thioclava sp. GXIMD2076]|uniref:Succinate dehydrogenase cytochrome b556 subunit n=1 Tax=Thioclava kandeliae TaxID=3070818 RepID=A0ABV1SEJ5_9RHOB